MNDYIHVESLKCESKKFVILCIKNVVERKFCTIMFCENWGGFVIKKKKKLTINFVVHTNP